MGTSKRLLVVLAVVLAACSPAATETTSTTAGTTAGTEAPAATEPAMADTTTTAPAAETTQPSMDGNATVEAKTAAVLAALPDGWTGSTDAAVNDAANEDFAYDPCLLPDDFDIDNLDDYSAAALVASFEGPPSDLSPFGAPRGSIEARVFNSAGEAEEAFAVFSRIWGTPEGLECMTNSVIAIMGDDMPVEEFTVTTESVSVAGSQAGARFILSFDIQGFTGAIYVEFQGAVNGPCTTIASFITFVEPFDRDVADAVFQAAVSA